jgi:hypothetical protein
MLDKEKTLGVRRGMRRMLEDEYTAEFVFRAGKYLEREIEVLLQNMKAHLRERLPNDLDVTAFELFKILMTAVDHVAFEKGEDGKMPLISVKRDPDTLPAFAPSDA